MNPYPDDVGAEIEAYAAYLNAPRGILDQDEQVLFDQDLLKATVAGEKFQEYFFANATDEGIREYLKGVVSA